MVFLALLVLPDSPPEVTYLKPPTMIMITAAMPTTIDIMLTATVIKLEIPDVPAVQPLVPRPTPWQAWSDEPLNNAAEALLVCRKKTDRPRTRARAMMSFLYDIVFLIVS